MKKEKHYWHLNDKVYGVWVTLIVNLPISEAEKYLNEWYIDAKPIELMSTVGGQMGKVFDKDTETITGYFLYLEHFNWTIEEQGTLVHEVFHLVIDIFARRNVSIGVDDDEAGAYYIGFWVRKIYEALQELHPKIKRKKAKK